MKIAKTQLKEMIREAVRKMLDEQFQTMHRKEKVLEPGPATGPAPEIKNKTTAMNELFRFMTIENPSRVTLQALLAHINGPLTQKYGREVVMMVYDRLKGGCIKITSTGGGKEIAVWDKRCAPKKS